MSSSTQGPNLDTGDADQADEGDLLSLHQGEALMRFATTYPTLNLTIVEAVQNAIDASAKHVFIGINPTGREVVVLDDGEGVTHDKFRRALRSVGKTIKRSGSLGRFGLGLISPLDKCRTYVFASHASGADHANIWTFRGEEIVQQPDNVQVPFVKEAKLPRVPRRFSRLAAALNCGWRTMVHLREVTEDKVVSTTSLDELQGAIQSKLGIGMRRAGTTVHIVINDGQGNVEACDIDPADFLGQPLEVVEFDGGECGKVVFELYRARKSGGKRQGKVFFMELDDAYPVPLREVRTQCMGLQWLDITQDAFEVLGSGYFEGIIRAEKIELAPERNKFKPTDALKAMYLATDWWYQHHGRQYYEDETEAQREERYRELGEKSLARLLAEMDESFSRQLLELFPGEATAEEALERKSRKIGPSGSGSSTARRTRTPAVARSPKPPSQAGEEQPGKRQGRAGLKFAYEMLPGSSYLWEFDPEAVVMTFNIRHPVWVMLDETKGRHTAKNDRQIMHLQEWLTLEWLDVVVEHGGFDFDFDVARLSIDRRTKRYVKHFIIGKS